jgi:hypothetical protein
MIRIHESKSSVNNEGFELAFFALKRSFPNNSALVYLKPEFTNAILE